MHTHLRYRICLINNIVVNSGSAAIDHTGKIVIPARQNGRTHFSNGLSRISVDREEGFIDKTGKMVIEPNFGRAQDFRDGLAYVTDAENGRSSYIDTAGTVEDRRCRLEWRHPGAG